MHANTRARTEAQDTSPANDLTPECLTLQALRHEIDRIDDEMLGLLHRRLMLARRVGKAKDAPHGPFLNLRPDREAAVLDRLLEQATDLNRTAVAPIWREVIAAGLAQQGTIGVALWRGVEDGRTWDRARQRFGSQMTYLGAANPKAALDAAQLGETVAVLNLSAEQPWWIDLARDYPDLWVFESLDDARGTPVALCVGRMDPRSLAEGRVFSVTVGGDAGMGEGHRRTLASHHGWSLSVTEGGNQTMDRTLGVIGRCG
jgi:chorismate mutase